MNKPSLTGLQRQIKTEAKKMKRAGVAGHMEALELLAKERGFTGYHELQKAAGTAQTAERVSASAEILDCIPGLTSVYRVRIGLSIWSLRISESGPLLSLDDRPPGGVRDRFSVSDIGLFQVLVRAEDLAIRSSEYPARGWVVTRYGNNRCHTAEFLSDAEAEALSFHFGIPLSGRFARLRQQETSEMHFCKSPAFAALRHALRHGRQPLPDIVRWLYGLSGLWAHLVAVSDEDFRQAGQITDWYYRRRRNQGGKVAEYFSGLRKHWARVPALGATGAGIDDGLIRAFRKSEAARQLYAQSRAGVQQ